MDWETISFDCYGTLVDWRTGIAGAFAEAAAWDGVQVEANRVLDLYADIEAEVEAGEYRSYREVLAEAARRVAARLGWRLAPEAASFLSESLPHWPVFPDTREALERLKSRFQIAILSNVDDDLLVATLRRIGVKFDWTVTAEQVRGYKPAPGHFRAAMERTHRGSLLHAAQSYFHDIVPATDLGLPVVWVNRREEPLPGNDPHPTHVVSDLTQLADWLDV